MYSFYNNSDVNILLLYDFYKLIDELKALKIKNKKGLFCFLIDRSLHITPRINSCPTLKAKTNRNRVILLKTLFELDKECFLSCFYGKNVPLINNNV